MIKKVCGLGMLADKAALAGYKNANGTVNLLLVDEVIKKHGKLIPKDQLSKAELKELEEAGRKLFAKLHNPDSFNKTI